MMSQKLSVLLAQINPTVGAIKANAEKIRSIIQAHQSNHDIILFPELALTGYPPEDLLMRKAFHVQVENALRTLQAETENCHVIIGHPHLEQDRCFNAARVFYQKTCIAGYHKQHLPNYGVFDEARYFTPGEPTPCLLTVKDYRLGLLICEDLWQEGPVEQLVQKKANGLLCINASPFDYTKPTLREQLIRQHAQKGLAIFYVNQVGGQDELLFDGQSLVCDSHGLLQARAPAFKEHLQTVVLENDKITSQNTPTLPLTQDALIYEALVCGTRDYIEKNGFPGILLGLSGGIDSALTLAIAVDALGASRVHAVMMPSRYTASISVEDAQKQLKALKVESTLLPIEPLFKTVLSTLDSSFSQFVPDTTEENIQARIRGTLLMALSNKTGKMVLTTSNKSELAVGYSTLYGDMAGGFAVLKDVFKTQVYALAHYRNQRSLVIPQRVITRAPSAELAENQTDQDTLPPYTVLDAIIQAYLENQSIQDLIQLGYSAEDVQKTIGLIKRNEYKRRQAPPGIKISTRAFGRDWRYPITSGFSEDLT